MKKTLFVLFSFMLLGIYGCNQKSDIIPEPIVSQTSPSTWDENIISTGTDYSTMMGGSGEELTWNSNDNKQDDQSIIKDYYKALSKKQFAAACLLKADTQDCEQKLTTNYKDILIAIPYAFTTDSQWIISYEVYYEDKATLRSSIYEVKKTFKDGKMVDVSSKLKPRIYPQEFDVNQQGLNIYSAERYFISSSYTGAGSALDDKLLKLLNTKQITQKSYENYYNTIPNSYILLDTRILLKSYYKWFLEKPVYSDQEIDRYIEEEGTEKSMLPAGMPILSYPDYFGYSKMAAGESKFIKAFATTDEIPSIEPLFIGRGRLLFYLNVCGGGWNSSHACYAYTKDKAIIKK